MLKTIIILVLFLFLLNYVAFPAILKILDRHLGNPLASQLIEGTNDFAENPRRRGDSGGIFFTRQEMINFRANWRP